MAIAEMVMVIKSSGMFINPMMPRIKIDGKVLGISANKDKLNDLKINKNIKKIIIHYIHRFKAEFQKDGDYLATMYRSHNSIGLAMFYTSITVTLGFLILALSSFIPSIYFGVFTAIAMVSALLANLTLLPKLILIVKPKICRTKHM
jgi:hypothetical protein